MPDAPRYDDDQDEIPGIGAISRRRGFWDSDWHVSKTIPLSLILAVVMQTAGIAWVARGIQSETEINARQIEANHEAFRDYRVRTSDQINRLRSDVQALRQSVQTQSVHLGRIDQNMAAVRETMTRMADEISALAAATRANTRDRTTRPGTGDGR